MRPSSIGRAACKGAMPLWTKLYMERQRCVCVGGDTCGMAAFAVQAFFVGASCSKARHFLIALATGLVLSLASAALRSLARLVQGGDAAGGLPDWCVFKGQKGLSAQGGCAGTVKTHVVHIYLLEAHG